MKHIAGLVLATVLIVLEWPSSSCISLSLLNAQTANGFSSLMNKLGGGMGQNNLMNGYGMGQNNLMNGYGMGQNNLMNKYGMMMMGGMGGSLPLSGFNKGLNYGINKYNPDLAGKKNLGARVVNNELRRKYFEEKEAAERKIKQPANDDDMIDNEERFSRNQYKKQKNDQLKKLSVRRRPKVNRPSEEQYQKNSVPEDENVHDEELKFKPVEMLNRAPERPEQTFFDLNGERELKEKDVTKMLNNREPINSELAQPSLSFNQDEMSPFYAPPSPYVQDSIQKFESNPQNEIDSKVESVISGLMAPRPSYTNVDANLNLIEEMGRLQTKDAPLLDAQPSINSENKEQSKNLQYGKIIPGKKNGPNGFSSLIVISNTNTNNNLAENSENQFSSDHVIDFLSSHDKYTVAELLAGNVTQMMLDHFEKDQNQINSYLKENEYTKELKANMPTYNIIDNRDPVVDLDAANSNGTESIVTLKKQGINNHEHPKDDLTYSYMPYGNGGILVINNANKNRNEKLKRILSGEGVNIINPSGGIELPLSKEEIEKLLEEAIIVSNENSNSNLLK